MSYLVATNACNLGWDMSYLVATNAKVLETKDKDKCLTSRNKLVNPKVGPWPESLAHVLVRRLLSEYGARGSSPKASKVLKS